MGTKQIIGLFYMQYTFKRRYMLDIYSAEFDEIYKKFKKSFVSRNVIIYNL